MCATFAYQGYGRGLPLDVLRLVNGFACEDLAPDVTILLDVRPEVAEARMRRREAATNTAADRIEQAGGGFHERLRAGFMELAAADPARIKVLDANGTPDEVWEKVLGVLKETA